MGLITIIKKIVRKITPKEWYKVYRLDKIICGEYGYLKSLKCGLPVDKNRKPLPWYTYPAIEYVQQLNLKEKIVFEYGSGNSSLFFAEKCSRVVTVEDDITWFNKISQNKPENLNMLLETNEADYLSSIEKTGVKFDIIIIDASHRLKCCNYIKQNLKNGGMVILDNSDWFNDAALYLRDKLNLIQIDFSGFGPINDYTWTTSLFLSRDFNFKTSDNNQPRMPKGGIK